MENSKTDPLKVGDEIVNINTAKWGSATDYKKPL